MWDEISLPDELEKGVYVMTLHHFSKRGEARDEVVNEFRATFSVGDETSKEEMYS
ncbi:hypothetical protein IMZ48_49850, partial [Candidatus Bathyarchaeota archaeon]|nr:hypothetical protein [Candidatus Bathyarchaeota archaeon]